MPSVRPKSSHTQSLKVKCFFCPTGKAPTCQLSESHKTFISEKVFPRYRQFERLFPSGECGNCNKIVCDIIKNGQKAKRKLVNQDYDEILQKMQSRQTALRKQTRFSPCKCFICKVVKKDCILPKRKKATSPKFKKGRKCEICFSTISPGKHKNCSRKEGVKNLMGEVSRETRMKLCLETLKEEQSKKQNSSPIRVSSSLGGPAVSVSIMPSTSKVIPQ